MATDGFMLAEELTGAMVSLTTLKWSQKPGVRSEPISKAWKRIFRQPMPVVPVWFSHCVFEGRSVVVRFYPLGRLVVVDPWNGSAIRVVNRRAVERAANMGSALQAYDPMSAHFQSHGRLVTTRHAGNHHGRVAGAAENFLREGVQS